MASLQSLPERKQAYVRGRVKGLSKKDSALQAGYEESVANIAGQKLETEDVREVMRKLVQEALPPKTVVDVLKAGLTAEVVQRASYLGKFTDEARDPDHRTRANYVQLVAEYAGYVVKDQAQSNTLIVMSGQAPARVAPAIPVESSVAPVDPPSQSS